MRGSDGKSGSFFSYVDLDERIPKTHPLRLIWAIVNDVLSDLSGDFCRFTWLRAGLRLRPRSCSGPCFCRPSIRSVRNAS